MVGRDMRQRHPLGRPSLLMTGPGAERVRTLAGSSRSEPLGGGGVLTAEYPTLHRGPRGSSVCLGLPSWNGGHEKNTGLALPVDEGTTVAEPQIAGAPQASKPATDAMTLLVAAVIVHDREAGRIVLLQRGPRAKFAQGMWDLPVGKSEPGEPVTETAVRELREETGLVVVPEDLRLAHVIHGARGVEAPDDFLTVVFAVHAWSGELFNVEPDKHAQVAWIPIDAIPVNFVSTTRSALIRYLTGGPGVSLDSWS
jgi:8-oxo-dGTP pyrophosphatase MutT (NUDIX family)